MSPFPYDDEDEAPEREIVVADLREDGRGTRNHLADALGAAVGHLLDRMRDGVDGPDEQGAPEARPVRDFLMEATATAAGAVEGTLKSKSLDGALKLAQIEEAYARKREANAQAELHLAQAQQIREEMAFQRLERVLELVNKLGGNVALVQLEDGRLAITVGDGLAEPLPLATAADPRQASGQREP